MLKEIKSIIAVFAILTLVSFETFGQQQNYLFDEVPLERRLKQLRTEKNPELLLKYNDSFKLELRAALENKLAFEYPFSSLKSIGKITSKDEQVRVISWNVQLSPEQNIYNCFILKKKRRRNEHDIIELIDDRSPMPPSTKETLHKDKWYGCLYYDIVEVEKGRKTYYTLLGYDLKDTRSHIKIIDVLYFTGRKLNLGYEMFNTENGVEKRVLLEHSKKAVMTLRYDDKRDKIVFDHLSPETPGLKEFREFYVPDMSYDAYNFIDELWILEEDVIANNSDSNKKMTIYKFDNKSDSVIQEEVKQKWNSPDGGNAPISNGSHEAQKVPKEELQGKETASKKKELNEKKKKEKAPEFKGVQFGNLGGKKKKNSKK